MQYQIFEPKQNFRFEMEIDAIPHASITVHTSDFPNMDNSETVVEQFNYQFYVKGKSKWQTITVGIYDPISPNLAQQLYAWQTAGHHSEDGRTDQYAVDMYTTCYLYDMDPSGAIVNTWQLKECYAQSINWGSGDWSAEEVKNIELTLRYNGAIFA